MSDTKTATEAEIRADERARCVAELRAYAEPRLNDAVADVSAGKSGGIAVVIQATAMGLAASLLESGELSDAEHGGEVSAR
ncbi:hypothetical protein [Nonomuraea wenchangensis]|uniref:Uncharacterized protein n=1 Tax=Nonomuraea wenchangensis TaxID=568860 RepID=A0A1I0F0B1_9ACTN|nr:hypothetical protein [Nonomuraea wenchangensis]SET51067.1 hypothetical protein SAMN05421811_103265 [Nonomuraea wenchangensis]